MEKEIDITEILKDKPVGTKLYADAFGELKLNNTVIDNDAIIYTKNRIGLVYSFHNDGKYDKNGEPILVPSKEMHDWSKFSWKKGDVLVSKGDKTLRAIFEGFEDDTYTTFKGKHFLCDYGDNEEYNEEEYNDYHKEVSLRTIEFEKDNEGDAQTYINTIEKRLGGKLNRETLEIEPFKSNHVFKPLEYVLSNDNEDNEWTLCQFSHFDKKGNAVFVGGNYADKGKVILHYEGNEHLLGTTKDVEE